MEMETTMATAIAMETMVGMEMAMAMATGMWKEKIIPVVEIMPAIKITETTILTTPIINKITTIKTTKVSKLIIHNQIK